PSCRLRRSPILLTLHDFGNAHCDAHEAPETSVGRCEIALRPKFGSAVICRTMLSTRPSRDGAPPTRGGQILSRPIAIEIEHRHCGLVGRALAARAPLGGALQRGGNFFWICALEHAALEIEGVALVGDRSRPFLLCHAPAPDNFNF